MRFRSEAGFGLTELVVAMAILLVGILAVSAMLLSGVIHIRNASQITTAGALANTEMEKLQGVRWLTIGLDEVDIAATDSVYTGDGTYESNASNRVALTSCGTSPCTTMKPTRSLTGADGRQYRVDTYANWRNVPGGRRVKEITVVVRDNNDANKVWDRITSSFDGEDPNNQPPPPTPPNEAPVFLNPGGQYTERNQQYTLDLNADDPNSDPLTWTVTGLPPGMVFDPITDRVTGRATLIGVYPVVVTISDGEFTDTGTFLWTVVNNNTLPLNIAIGRTVNQSSTRSGDYGPGNAIDGNTNGDASAGFLAMTNYEAQPWWDIDLGANYAIGRVRLWNRTDCCNTRLANFYVMSSPVPFSSNNLNDSLNSPDTKWFHVSGEVGSVANINFNEAGRYVRIQLAGTNWLQLAEVEIFTANEG